MGPGGFGGGVCVVVGVRGRIGREEAFGCFEMDAPFEEGLGFNCEESGTAWAGGSVAWEGKIPEPTG